jgi:hypothetical protein
MTLQLIEDSSEIKQAQVELERRLKSAWRNGGTRKIVWRPGKEDMNIHHDDQFYFASKEVTSSKSHRYWNSFGTFKESGTLNIAVEVNIPKKNNARVAGFFARDSLGGVHLLHDGSVGGGTPGVSRANFLEYLGRPYVEVISRTGTVRPGVVVCSLRAHDFIKKLGSFLHQVVVFKAAIKSGKRFGIRKHQIDGLGSYFDEYSGSKKRKALAEIAYITRHGDIVKAVKKWRGLRKGEEDAKSRLVDWAVLKQGRMIELYEIKTCCDRYSLYAAIGQLFVHSGKDVRCKRVIVIPANERVPKDVQAALGRLGITEIRFTLTATSVHINEP